MKIGMEVENFQLNDQYNNKFDLYENLNQDVLLAFYPKDNSPVCTKQLVDYTLNQLELKKFGIKIIGKDSNREDSKLAVNVSCRFRVLKITSGIEGYKKCILPS